MGEKPKYEELEKRIQELEKEAVELRKLEEPLKESEVEYRDFFNLSPNPVAVVQDEVVKLANSAYTKLFGVSQEDIDNGFSLYEHLQKKDKDAVHQRYKERLSSKELQGVHQVEIRSNNGKKIPCEAYSSLIQYEGRPALLAIIRDISKRKQAEETLRKEEKFTKIALDSQLDTFFLFEPATGKSILWNRAFNDITGYSDEEIAGMAAPASYYSPEDLERAAIFTQGALEKGTGTIELGLICKDGRKVPSEYKVSVVKIQEGGPEYFISIGRDITERKKAEEELEKHTKELSRVNAELKNQARNLEETNAALKVLLRQRDRDKKELEEKVVSNVKEMIFPYVEKLKTHQLDKRQMVYVNIIESHLSDVISPFIHQLSSKFSGLTPSEIKVAGFVKDGKTTKEIAELLNLSIGAVNFHRNNLRQKLGLRNKKTNLRSRLLSLD